MTDPRRLIAAVLALTLTAVAGRATAQELAPAIVFDMGGKFDKSFNEAAYNGAERFKKETGIAYREFEVTAEAQREQALRNMARRGSQIVVGVGFSQASGMEKVAKEFPAVKFAIVDAVVDLPNVQSIVFKEHEGSFLVGMAAAMASKTGKVGFVGGMDIPLIRKFALGYEEGARYVNPKIEVFQNMTGTTPAAWNDPTRGGELAGASSTAAPTSSTPPPAATGLGVLQAAKDKGRARDRGRLQPEPHSARLRADLDGQARRPRRLRGLQDREGRDVEVRRAQSRRRRERRRLLAGPVQPRPDHAGDGAPARAGPRRHRRRQDQGHRLHGEVRPGGCASAGIELRGIDKRFGDVHANRDLSLIVREGTVHGLVGENGAGKSTLMGILSGYHRPDRGEILVRGRPAAIRSPHDALVARDRHGAPALHAGGAVHGPGKRRPRRRGGLRGSGPGWHAPAPSSSAWAASTTSRSTPTRASPISAWASASAWRS